MALGRRVHHRRLESCRAVVRTTAPRNYALSLLAEAIGHRIPIVALPFVNTNLAERAPFRRSVAALRTEGVRIMLGPGEWQPHPPGAGSDRLHEFPWSRALDRITRAAP